MTGYPSVTAAAAALGVLASVLAGPVGCRRGAREAAGSAGGKSTVRWSLDLDVGVYSRGPVVGADGTLYAFRSEPASIPPPGYASAEGYRHLCLIAIDSEGNVTRSLPGTMYKGPSPTAWITASAAGNAAYAVDNAGGVYGLFAGGQQRYAVAGTRFSGHPAVTSRGDAFAVDMHGLLALELYGDPPIRRIVDVGAGTTRPAVLGPNDTLYFGSNRRGGQIYATWPNGSVQWQARSLDAEPVLVGDSLVIARKNVLAAYSTYNGDGAWELEVAAPIATRPAPAPDGSVFVATDSGIVYSIARGEVRWSHPLEAYVLGEVVVDAEGAAYVADQNGTAYCLDAGGRRRWTIRSPKSYTTPVPGLDGSVYLRSSDEYLHAVTPPSPAS